MSLSPQKFREVVLQLLYSQDIAHPDQEEMIELMSQELALSKKYVRLALERTGEIQTKIQEIDEKISSVSTSYDFDRIQKVTLNILRIGVFELYFDEKIPPKVAIAEAIRLSRKFSTPESATFVNALLDHLYQKKLGRIKDSTSIEKQAALLAESEQATTQAYETLKNLQFLEQGDEVNEDR